MIDSVVCRVKGGLGNQLYIYAHAVTIERTMNVSVELDTVSGYILDGFARKSLLHKVIKAGSYREATPKTVIKGYLRRLLWKAGSKHAYYYENGSGSSLDAFIGNKRNNTLYIEGYWQNTVQSTETIAVIKKQYLSPKIPAAIRTISDQLERGEAAIVHYRIDRVEKKTPGSFFSSTSFLDLCKQVSQIYVITDGDRDQVQAEFPKFTVIKNTEDEETDLVEFDLLRRARIKCLAHSTFSRWAALLSNGSDTILWQTKNQ